MSLAYANLLRAHRIEPYGQALSYPGILANGQLDIDNWSTFGASFRQLVLTGNIAPPMMTPGAGTAITATMASAIEATIQANDITGAWSYLMDEPPSSQFSNIISWAGIIHANAPDLKVMVTTVPQSGLPAGTIDIYSPIEAAYSPGAFPAGSACTFPVRHTGLAGELHLEL